MTSPESGHIAPVVRKVGWRFALLGVPLVAFYWLVARADDADAIKHRIGTAYLAYDQRASCIFIKGERPVVLDSGLQDGRGLAFARDTSTLYVADAWERVYAFSVQPVPPAISNAPPPPAVVLDRATEMCPEGHCAQIEYGGLFWHPQRGLIVSDAHRQQLLVRSREGFLAAIGGPLLRSVKDVTSSLQAGRLLVVESDPDADERPSGSPSGRIYEVDLDKPTEMQAIAKELRRPIGVVASSRTNRIYVADLEATFEVWFYYRKEGEEWRKGGALWRQPLGPYRPAIRLQSMVLAHYDPAIDGQFEGYACERSHPTQPEEVIVSAGPDGLYFFHSDGALLAKYFLGRPVAGVTWGPEQRENDRPFNWLYFTSGRQLGALKTRLRRQ